MINVHEIDIDTYVKMLRDNPFPFNKDIQKGLKDEYPKKFYAAINPDTNEVLSTAYLKDMGGYSWVCYLQNKLGTKGAGKYLLLHIINNNKDKEIALKVRNKHDKLYKYYKQFGFTAIPGLFGQDDAMKLVRPLSNVLFSENIQSEDFNFLTNAFNKVKGFFTDRNTTPAHQDVSTPIPQYQTTQQYPTPTYRQVSNEELIRNARNQLYEHAASQSNPMPRLPVRATPSTRDTSSMLLYPPLPTTSLSAVPGYSQVGEDNQWRASNDSNIYKYTKAFNDKHGFKPGDHGYLDPNLVKAWQMMESGGHKDAFLSDPFQTNNPGDWGEGWKEPYGLEYNVSPGMELSTKAGIEMLYKKAHRNGEFVDWGYGLRNYNGNTKNTQIYDPSRPEQEHRDYYRDTILKWYDQMTNPDQNQIA